jgi:nitroreductase
MSLSQHQSDASSNNEKPLEHNNSHKFQKEASSTHDITFVDTLLCDRFSCRYFLPSQIPSTHTLNSIFESARHAPSGSNFQLWKIHVLRNDPKSQVSAKVQTAFDHDNEAQAETHKPPYAFYPDADELAKPEYRHLLQRRNDFGAAFYGPLGIDRSDATARRAVTKRNWAFFDAPVGLIVTTTDIASTGSYLDVGFFVMSLLVSARAHGLRACVQESLATFQDVYAEELGLEAGRESVVCGVAVGYADLERVREFGGRQRRMGSEEMVVWHG